VVCITQLEKEWNKRKAEIFEQEDLVQVFFMDIKKLLFLENKLTTVIYFPLSMVSEIDKSNTVYS
jgi:hypothetical protein